MTRAPLPRLPARWHGSTPAGRVEFTVRPEVIEAGDVAPDMQDLAARVRSLLDLQRGTPLRLPLGGRLFDIVVTAASPEAFAAVRFMDDVQRMRGARPGTPACGPVIEDPERGRLIWLVPPGTHEGWEPSPGAVCLGAPYELALPALRQTSPPGPYWLRPCRGDRLVPPLPLVDFLRRTHTGRVPRPRETLLGACLGLNSQSPRAAEAYTPVPLLHAVPLPAVGQLTWHSAAGAQP